MSRRSQPDPAPVALATQVIYCGDSSAILRGCPANCVDLVYIDPPFNSNRTYDILEGRGKRSCFDDRHASAAAYIDFMRPCCRELVRVLRETGSFYYHCDHHAGPHVRLMLDDLFGARRFRSEIIWRRTNAKGLAFRGFPRNHDTLLYYTASPVSPGIASTGPTIRTTSIAFIAMSSRARGGVTA